MNNVGGIHELRCIFMGFNDLVPFFRPQLLAATGVVELMQKSQLNGLNDVPGSGGHVRADYP